MVFDLFRVGLRTPLVYLTKSQMKTGQGILCQPIPSPSVRLGQLTSKPRIFLTTVKIPDEHLWANGLYQNVYVVYKMFENMGMEPWLLVDNNDNNKDAALYKTFRTIDFKTYIVNPFPVVSYIEIAMSCEAGIRKFFRSMGAKTAKTYLGNILNIDIETITFYNGVNFSHHVAGELDEIFVSPHYDIHGEYAGSINGICGKTRIAPYVWEPLFIEQLPRYDPSGLTTSSARNFLIMEPNISFQKNSIIPILALEAYYRKFPNRIDTITVINGQKLKDSQFFSQTILPNLTVFKAGKLHLMPRAHFINIVKVFRNAIVIQHQVNNSYNYSFLEWMTLGYPLIHNVPQFKDYGYYYDANDFDMAEEKIEQIVEHHGNNVDTYKTMIKQLAWRFSIYNPENIDAWRKLAFEKS